MLRAALGKKLCLGWLQLKKHLGAALDKNMIRAALGQKGLLGAATAQQNSWELRQIKICFKRR